MSSYRLLIICRYEVREESTWGLPIEGNFTGMMGVLQREEADLSTICAPFPDRFTVMDFIRGYPSDKTTVVTMKPSLLNQYLAIIRPFLSKYSEFPSQTQIFLVKSLFDQTQVFNVTK